MSFDTIIFTRNCDCCNKQYESYDDDSWGCNRCSCSWAGCYRKDRLTWVRGPRCPINTNDESECIHNCTKRDRYREALELIYKRLNDTVQADYNMYPEIHDIVLKALYPELHTLKDNQRGH